MLFINDTFELSTQNLRFSCQNQGTANSKNIPKPLCLEKVIKYFNIYGN